MNKNKALSSIQSVRNSLHFQPEARRNNGLTAKYQNSRDKETIRFQKLLKLIEKGAQRTSQQNRIKRNIEQKINLSLAYLEKSQKMVTNATRVNEKIQAAKEKCFKRGKINTQESKQTLNDSLQSLKQWQVKMNSNQRSIKFPQLGLFKQTLIIEQSPMCQKKSKERLNFLQGRRKEEMKEKSSLSKNGANILKKQAGVEKNPKSLFNTLQQSQKTKITKWTINEWY